MTSTLSRDAARRLRASGAFHLPPPACPVGTIVTLEVEAAPEQPEIVFTDERRNVSWQVAMSAAEPGRWTAQAMMPMDATIVRYTVQFPDGTVLRERRQDEGRNRPVFGVWREAPFQIAVYDPAGMPPDWTQGMVLYQIFPDRFDNADPSNDRLPYGVYGLPPLFKAWGDVPEAPPRGRDFYGGDLKGVTRRLDYLAELGVECIYFTPIFESPSNHRYDAIDYMKIDPVLGTEADFDGLLAEAHRRGIRIVLDAVYNHCSVDALYFGAGGRFEEVGAREAKESPYYRWFNFTNWPAEWVGWNGHSHMPEFAECPEVEEFFTGPNGPTAKWTAKGIDGWRTDVTSCNSDVFWRRWRRRLNQLNPATYTVAEEWENASHYLLGDMFSATMNYRFAWALYGYLAYDRLTPTELDDRLQIWLRDTPGPAQKAQMNLIDSHDTFRALTECKGDRRRFRQMVVFQFAYPGAPMIYYGDETGLEGTFTEDGRRTMPWDALDAELLGFYRELIAYRRGAPALRLGDVETVVLDDATRAYGFVRRYGDDAVYALFNASDAPVTVDVPLRAGEDGTWADGLRGHPSVTAWGGVLRVTLEARGAALYARE